MMVGLDLTEFALCKEDDDDGVLTLKEWVLNSSSILIILLSVVVFLNLIIAIVNEVRLFSFSSLKGGGL